MALLDRMKLQKLTIKAYRKTARSVGDLIGTFEAPFNPDSFSQKYVIEYGKHQGLNSTNKPVNYSRSKPRELSLKLLLDGTGVQDMGILQLGKQKTVSTRVKEFLDLTFHMNGDIHEPNFLVAEWGGKEDGGLIFSCRLGSVDVAYTSFNRDGSPLRAELDVTLISDQDIRKRMARENKNSPDLTHSRVVKSGDSLPLLTKEVYGSSAYYLRIAQVNGLDDFRNLTPGQTIIFPPLEKEL
jgi:nucleoid-associated protein YgaU